MIFGVRVRSLSLSLFQLFQWRICACIANDRERERGKKIFFNVSRLLNGDDEHERGKKK